MNVGDGVVWSESLPDNTTSAHQIDDYNRDLRLGVRTRMAREHIWTSSQTATNEGGHHQFITFQQSTAAPSLSTALTQVGALFVGSSGDGYPLTFENSAGSSAVIISSAGKLAVITSGTLGSIPICSSASPDSLTILAGPTSTTGNKYLLVSNNNATGGVQAATWGTISMTSTDTLGPLVGVLARNKGGTGYSKLVGSSVAINGTTTVTFAATFSDSSYILLTSVPIYPAPAVWALVSKSTGGFIFVSNGANTLDYLAMGD
jgi:hypothetical protein